jgi:hypothetical protein
VISKLLDPSQHQPLIKRVNEALLQKFVKQSNEMRSCPRQGCGYAGFINLNQTCTNNLVCLLCNTQWRDPVHYTNFEKTMEEIKDVFMMRGETLSQVIKLVTTEPCPNENCGFLI